MLVPFLNLDEVLLHMLHLIGAVEYVVICV